VTLSHIATEGANERNNKKKLPKYLVHSRQGEKISILDSEINIPGSILTSALLARKGSGLKCYKVPIKTSEV